MAADKRGSRLALTLARLDDLVQRNGGAKTQRIGLSATVRPPEAVARFLSDTAEIVDVGSRRAMKLAVEVPADELGAVATSEMWAEIYDRVAALVREHTTTLVFVGTRRISERVAFALGTRLGEGVVLPHHGSLSRDIRFATENRLKTATCGPSSPRRRSDSASTLAPSTSSSNSVAAFDRRRLAAGRTVGPLDRRRTRRPTLRDNARRTHRLRRARARHAQRRDGRIAHPVAPLDVLAQQLVATCAGDDWDVDELFALVRSTQPYRELPRKDFDDVLAMLADGIATSRGRSGAFLHHDRVNGRVRTRRGSRMAAIMSGGAIPETANYNVVAEPEGTVIGHVDEDFAIESLAGDVFLLARPRG